MFYLIIWQLRAIQAEAQHWDYIPSRDWRIVSNCGRCSKQVPPLPPVSPVSPASPVPVGGEGGQCDQCDCTLHVLQWLCRWTVDSLGRSDVPPLLTNQRAAWSSLAAVPPCRLAAGQAGQMMPASSGRLTMRCLLGLCFAWIVRH